MILLLHWGWATRFALFVTIVVFACGYFRIKRINKAVVFLQKHNPNVTFGVVLAAQNKGFDPFRDQDWILFAYDKGIWYADRNWAQLGRLKRAGWSSEAVNVLADRMFKTPSRTPSRTPSIYDKVPRFWQTLQTWTETVHGDGGLASLFVLADIRMDEAAAIVASKRVDRDALQLIGQLKKV